MGKDTHALSEPAQRTALEVLAANGVETVIQRDDGVHARRRSSRTRSSSYNRGRTPASRGRHRRHAVAQPARGRRLQVQPAARRPGRHRRDGVDRGPGQRAPARRQRRREARAVREGHQRPRPRTRKTSSCPTCADLRERRRHGGHPGRGPRRSASIRSAAPASRYWEPINSVYELDIAVVNPVSIRPSRS